MPEQLHKCFPTISASEEGPEALENARTQIQKYFHSTCMRQVDHLFTERDIEQKLNQLDEIIQSAQRARDEGSRKQIQVDKLSAEELIQASLHEVKPDTEKKLAMIYEQLVMDNEQLHSQLKDVTNETFELSNEIMLSVEELSGEIDDMNSSDFDEKLKQLTQQYFSVES
ncbi:hypothetical protein JCM33374_g4755 [Metschnikowia sp. JCM 33374]|nr:hypothetical protein JCM33374_g4755 [Metschnikowia sp. JCM 33374]